MVLKPISSATTKLSPDRRQTGSSMSGQTNALKGGSATSMEQNIHQLEISNITSENVSSLYKWENNYYAIVRANRAIAAIENAKNVSNLSSSSVR